MIMQGKPKEPRPGAARAPTRLWRNERGQLVFRADEQAEPVAGVRLARCFPWSFRDRYVSIRNAEGREICLLASLEDADAETRRAIEAELDAQEFLPKITAVHGVDDRFDVMAWTVQTDRGPIELQVKHSEDIRQLKDGRVLIKDHAGGVFEVPDPASLDPRSRRLLEDRLI